MPAPTRNLEWLNHNSIRRYPLAQDATALDQDGAFEIPNDFIVGLDLPIAAGVSTAPEKFFVRRIGAWASGYSITIGYAADGGDIDVATALISRVGHTKNKTYALGGVEPFDDTMGKVTIGVLENIDRQPVGLWTFDLTGGRLDVDVVRPQLRTVSGLYVQNGADVVGPFANFIVLRAGTNIQLNVAQVSGQDPVITINAISGEGTVEACVCEGEGVSATPINTINLIRPKADGDFTLLGDDCYSFVEIEHGLKLIDTCCKPCCSCDELEAITVDLTDLLQRVGTLDDLYARLEAANQSYAVLLGTKLGDRGCETC